MSTPLGAAASTMHEMMMSYVESGFTRREAFEIVKEISVAMVVQSQKDNKEGK